MTAEKKITPQKKIKLLGIKTRRLEKLVETLARKNIHMEKRMETMKGKIVCVSANFDKIKDAFEKYKSRDTVLLSEAGVASELGVSGEKIDKWTALKSFPLGGWRLNDIARWCRAYRAEDVESYLAMQKNRIDDMNTEDDAIASLWLAAARGNAVMVNEAQAI